MQQYPYDSANFLTDGVFLLYGGLTGTTSSEQREAAYLLAEEQMTEHLSAFLLPTIVTGTYNWNGGRVELEYGHILSVDAVTIYSADWSNSCGMSASAGCAFIKSREYGLIDVPAALNCGGCGGVLGLPPYNVQVVYQSGLSTGSSTSPVMLSALVLAAQIHLNEWDVSLTNESTADIGIQKFGNQSYYEERKTLGNTVFGNSAMAQRIARMTKKYRAKSALRLR